MQFLQLSKQLKTVPSDDEYALAVLLARSLEHAKHNHGTPEQAAWLDADRERSRMLNERINDKARGQS